MGYYLNAKVGFYENGGVCRWCRRGRYLPDGAHRDLLAADHDVRRCERCGEDEVIQHTVGAPGMNESDVERQPTNVSLFSIMQMWMCHYYIGQAAEVPKFISKPLRGPDM